MSAAPETAEEFFAGNPEGLAIHRRVADVIARLGDHAIRVNKSQIAFRGARRGFAYVWRPGRYLDSDVPAVLSIALPNKRSSPRFKGGGASVAERVDAPP